MHAVDRDHAATGESAVSPEDGPALRDASRAARRIEADEAAATAARDRLRDERIAPIAADGYVRPHLAEGEDALACRPSAILKTPGEERALGYGGRLYLTTRRLIHVGQVTLHVRLSDITETTVVGERLLVTLRGREGLMFDVDRPRLLRTEISAAMRVLRG